MTNFKIKIIDDAGDMHIYTDATAIRIIDDTIEVEYEDKMEQHKLDHADEIVIKANH